MATYRVETPSGTYRVDGPDGASDDDVRAIVQKEIEREKSQALRSADSADLAVPGIPGEPGYDRRQAELSRRNDIAHKQDRKWRNSRTLLERAKDTGTFLASMPVRMATQGQHGIGDVASLVGAEGLASRLNSAERDFARANPDLIWTLGASGEVMAGIPALNTLGGVGRGAGRVRTPRDAIRDMRLQSVTDDLAAFNRQGVHATPSAFMDSGVQRFSRNVADIPIVGRPVRGSIDQSIFGARNLADDVASGYGRQLPEDAAGRIAVEGVDRFKRRRVDASPSGLPVRSGGSGLMDARVRRDVIANPARMSSLKTKQDALYDQAWSFLPASMRQGRAIEGRPRSMFRLENTREVLRRIQGRNQRMVRGRGGQGEYRAPIIEGQGFTSQIIDALNDANWSASLDTVRGIRSRFRRMVNSLPENERNALTSGDLRQIESALSRDIIGGLQAYRSRIVQNAQGRMVGGVYGPPNPAVARNVDRAIAAFRRADRFTRLSAERMQQAQRVLGVQDDLGMFKAIRRAAEQGDVPKIQALRRILRPEEMGEISSSLIREIGRPVASAGDVAKEMGFSINTFTTNWSKLQKNPAVVEMLFPDPRHRQALQDLVAITNRLSDLDKKQNWSGSGIANIGTGGPGALAAAGAVGTGQYLAAAAGALAFYGGASVLMSQPATARWLAGYLRLRIGASRNPAMNNALQQHIATLGALASREPALEQIHELIVRDNQRSN